MIYPAVFSFHLDCNLKNLLGERSPNTPRLRNCRYVRSGEQIFKAANSGSKTCMTIVVQSWMDMNVTS